MYFADTEATPLGRRWRTALDLCRTATLGPREPSAAQNVTVIITCKQCGAVNRAEAGTCCFCDARLSQESSDTGVAAPTRPATEGNLAVALDWRSEVTSRLKAYRARHKRPATDPAQPEFLFGDPRDAAVSADAPAGADNDSRSSAVASEPAAEAARAAARPRQPARPHSDVPAASSSSGIGVGRARLDLPGAERPTSGRLDIDVAQPPLDFGLLPSSGRWGDSDHQKQRPWKESAEARVYPVARLAQRRSAGLLDLGLLLFSYGAFLSLFVVLGGRFAFSKLDVAVLAATVALFYALYAAVFTFFGGATPGLMLANLRVVSFDGSDPTPGQLLWRSFGYLVSAGTLMFGFLAALWDEDTLCWHDRISQTYLTPDSSVPFSSSDEGAPPPRARYW
jgi:uncharacterized RDD family membrane protein YckC